MLYHLDPDVVELIAKVVKPGPFTPLNEALREYFKGVLGVGALPRRGDPEELDKWAVDPRNIRKHSRFRKNSPDALAWANSVPELRDSPTVFTSWTQLCEKLNVPVGPDSARRKLAEFVRKNRPEWPPVPEPN